MSSHQYLLTGVTGGLGSKILKDMLQKHKVPASAITATSRDALVGVDNFLFVSASEFDNDKRRLLHRNIVDGAKAAGVKKTWYVSLAFGGFGVNEHVSVQAVHNWTEEMLIQSGLDFVSLRAGVYADAFSLFLNWYPESKAIQLPKVDPPVSEGHLALTSREELGEGTASMSTNGTEAYPSVKPRCERKIVLLTAAESYTFVGIANAINDSRVEKQPVEYLEPAEWVETAAKNDLGAKSKAWFELRLVWFREMCNGALQPTDTALETLLDRTPLNGVQIVSDLVGSNANYTWHQNQGGVRSAK